MSPQQHREHRGVQGKAEGNFKEKQQPISNSEKDDFKF
jgi:hypothetical protein